MIRLCGSSMAHTNCKFQDTSGTIELRCGALAQDFNDCEYADKFSGYENPETSIITHLRSTNTVKKDYIVKICNHHSFNDEELHKLQPYLEQPFSLEALIDLDVPIMLVRIEDNCIYIDHHYAS